MDLCSTVDHASNYILVNDTAMNIKLVTQPKDSSLCGHSCVAMLMNIPLEQSVAQIGTKRGTRITQLVEVLKEKFISDNKLKKINRHKPVISQLPQLAIVRVRYDKLHSHWIIKNGEMVYTTS